MLEIRTFVGSGFAENAYLLWRPGATEAVAIDPGNDAARMIATLDSEKLQLQAILLTHAHLDHIEGVADIINHALVPIYLHSGDAIFYENAPAQAAAFGMPAPKKLPPVDLGFEHGQQLRVAGIDFEVRHVPGHAPGHVLLYVSDAQAAFVGDVVFQNSIGRTDLPSGNHQQLMRSIREHVMTLPDDTTLYSGHGPPTTVKQERAFNPFIAPMFGGSFG